MPLLHDFKVDDLAYVNKQPPQSNRVRKEPSRDSEMVGYIDPGQSVVITGGPTCADGWVWWQVQNSMVNGWTAEGDRDAYWLVPLLK